MHPLKPSAGCVDACEVEDATTTSEYLALEDRQAMLAAGIASPGTLVACLDSLGYRVPLPPTVAIAADRCLPVPRDSSTMLDIVLASEQMAIVEGWLAMLTLGAVTIRVHSREDGALLDVRLVDAREDHGLHFAFISLSATAARTDDGEQPAALPVAPEPLRPRTGALRYSVVGFIQEIDGRAERMLELDAAQMIGRSSLELVHPDDHILAISVWIDAISTIQPARGRVRFRRGDASWVWVDVEFEPIVDGGGEVAEVRVRLRDISEEMDVIARLERSEQMFRRLADALPIGLVRMDEDHTVTYANDIARRLLNIREGASPQEQTLTPIPQDRARIKDAVVTVLAAGEVGQLEFTTESAAAGRRRCSLTLIPLSEAGEAESGVMACITDITESTRLHEELEQRATVDSLTGCANRHTVMNFLADQLPHQPNTGVIFIDIDKFKPINDTLGHAAGDEVLVRVAATLHSVVRDGDLVGRLGGDEFLVVLPRGGDQTSAVAARISATLRCALVISSGVVDIGVSIGAVVAAPGESPEDLIARADAAMYRCKHSTDHQPVYEPTP